MNLHDLRQAQASYTERIEDVKKSREKLYKLRKKFVKDFSLEYLANMPIEKYVIGQGTTTFCRRLERELDGLGRILGSNAFKFGVYYGRTKEDPNIIYRNAKKWGDSPETAYIDIKPALIKLLKDGESNNIKGIIKNKISPTFKGKILSTYYPERYLNVFSNEHLNYFLKFFDLDTPELIKSNPVIKRDALLKFKNDDEVMRNWSADLFGNFLYFEYPKRPIKKSTQADNLLKDYLNPIFPINPVASEVVLNILPNSIQANQKNKRTNNSKPDYEKINRVNKKLGDRGEKIVKDFEINRLNDLNRPDLAEQVDRVSLKSDSYGYDILSYEEDNSVRYIEVKATRSKVGDANFYLTINELNTAKENPNYYIYIVFDILSKNPKIWIVNNPFNPENTDIDLTPISYRVSIKTNRG
ncbi:uncharacterized protein DUF3883 [Balneicella halophila]|uniref:Uncharacterized protein DUF3883 n=1 Tax=Balneicella halophila TaxID=1537566 RepID=A0A7L4UM77_BALHA|nr:DUF3883 domain-containing protein [Balneicella halophila]PVX49284.1 uncharacterized protein DUF3883 [Balneicella halophila]